MMSTLRRRVGLIRPGRHTGYGAVRPGTEPQQPSAVDAVEAGEAGEAGEAVEAGEAGAPPPVGSGLTDEDGLKVQARRAGMYVVTDASGVEVGRIRGDYVVGFTTDYGGRLRWFEDLDAARQAVVDEYQPGPAASA